MARRFRSIATLVTVTGLLVALSAGTAGATDFRAAKAGAPFAPRGSLVSAAGVGALAADDEIPGVALPASPFSDTLDGLAGDGADIYQVSLTQGQTFYASLQNTDSSIFGLILLKPGTPSWALSTEADEAYVAWNGLDVEEVMYTAEQTGTYYLVACDDPAQTSGSPGQYTISYGYPTNQPAVTANCSKTSLPYAGSTTITGRVVDASGTAMAGKEVDVFGQAYGSANWVWAGWATTDSNGNYSVTVTPKIRTNYVAVAFGNETYLDAESAAKTVYVKAYVYNPVAPTYMYAGKSASVYALLKPRHTAGTYPVRIYKYRYVNGSWKSYGYTNAKAANYSTYTKATASIKLPYRGRWRLRAVHTDGGHLTTYSSGYDNVTVK